MDDALAAISTRTTPQNQQVDLRQTRNAAGGYTFTLDDRARLRRFLTLGVDGGTYYTGAAELGRENAKVVFRMADTDHPHLVSEIVAVSERGLAPKQNPAIFALAIAASHGGTDARRAALAVLPRVCRTGTHLFLFARYIEQFRGWGRGLRRAVAGWYTSKSPDSLAFQSVKYRQREGWSHRDLLRLAHPGPVTPATAAVFDWVCRETYSDDTPAILDAFRRVHEPGADVPRLVADSDLSWEMLPDQALNDPRVWDTLLGRGMPQTALMRQLPRLTRLGLLPVIGGRTVEIQERLTDPARLRKARVHPINVLVAQRTYASGQSARGDTTWSPNRRIVDALDAAFYEAFGAVEPAGKRTMLALDVSGSMTQPVSGLPLSCREASAALALVQMATEPECETVGFTSAGGSYWSRTTALTPLPISPRQRLDDAVRAVSCLPFGGTDCSLPVRYALQEKIPVETFVTYTDSETWAGPVHVHQALREYRDKMGIPARHVVVGMTATECSIADPSDPGMLDVAGMDAAVPALINNFSRGL